jgi:hypothetical protein
VRLWTDDGVPSPELSIEPTRTLAELTAAIHAAASRLAEHERHLEMFIGKRPAAPFPQRLEKDRQALCGHAFERDHRVVETVGSHRQVHTDQPFMASQQVPISMNLSR